jgi:hypothetical protein
LKIHLGGGGYDNKEEEDEERERKQLPGREKTKRELKIREDKKSNVRRV